MSNVKPGDRAIVIKSRTGLNIGRIVLVIEEYKGQPMPPNNLPFDVEGRGLTWVVESLGSPILFIDPDGKILGSEVCVGPDDCLRRLDPPEEEQAGSGEGLSAPVKDSQTVEVRS